MINEVTITGINTSKLLYERINDDLVYIYVHIASNLKETYTEVKTNEVKIIATTRLISEIIINYRHKYINFHGHFENGMVVADRISLLNDTDSNEEEW